MSKRVTRNEVFKSLGIKKGDIIGEYFIPYAEIDSVKLPIESVYKFGISQVMKKFFAQEYSFNSLHIIDRYVFSVTGDEGILFIGIG